MDAASWILVRHAETLWNAEGRWQGQADPPLSDRGIGQAARLAARLARQRIDFLYCSDLQRARQTAERVGREIGIEPISRPEFRELDVGSWSGRRRGEIECSDREALARFDAGDPDQAAGGAETRADLARRVCGGVEALRREHPEQRILLVTHLGVIRALVPGSDPGHTDCIALRPAGPNAARRS